MSSKDKVFFAESGQGTGFFEALSGREAVALAERRHGWSPATVAGEAPGPLGHIGIYHLDSQARAPVVMRFASWQDAIAQVASSCPQAEESLRRQLAELLLQNKGFRDHVLTEFPTIRSAVRACPAGAVAERLNGICHARILSRALAQAPREVRNRFVQSHFGETGRHIRRRPGGELAGLPSAEFDGYMIGNSRNHSLYVSEAYVNRTAVPVSSLCELRQLAFNRDRLIGFRNMPADSPPPSLFKPIISRKP
jgi:hypothetical protein